MESTQKKQFKPVKVIKMHGSECSGCNNAVFSSTFELKEDRDLLIGILDKYIDNE